MLCCAHPLNTCNVFLSPSNTRSHTRMHFTVQLMIYSEGGGSSFVQMCASLNACPQWDKNHWPVLCGAHRHWHALHQSKQSHSSNGLSVSASKHSRSSSIFPLLLCQRLKKQRQGSRGEKCHYPCTAESWIPSENVWNSLLMVEVAQSWLVTVQRHL